MTKKSKLPKVQIKVSNHPKPIIPPAVKTHREAIKRLENQLAVLEQDSLAASPSKDRIRYQISQHSTAIDGLMKQKRKITGNK